MSTERFDTGPLRHAPGGDWPRFRTAAIAGEYGEELAVPQWWRRRGFGVMSLLFAVVIVAPPVLVLTVPGVDGVLIVTACVFTVVFAVVAATAAGSMRFDSWGPRARFRYRLAGFARVNGLEYRVDPGLGRLGAVIFGYGGDRRHRDHVTVPGPDGFTVAAYDCDPSPDDPETGVDHWGYAVFPLRESYPHTLLTRGRWGLSLPGDLAAATVVEPGPGWRMRAVTPEYPLLRRLLQSGILDHRDTGHRPRAIEIVGDRLFLLYGGHLNLGKPALWRQLAAVAQTLSPFSVSQTRSSAHDAVATAE